MKNGHNTSKKCNKKNVTMFCLQNMYNNEFKYYSNLLLKYHHIFFNYCNIEI